MLDSHYIDFSVRCEKSARNQHGSHYNDYSAISRQFLGVLDICGMLIMDADEDDFIAISLLLLVCKFVTCWIGCMWATDSLRKI